MRIKEIGDGFLETFQLFLQRILLECAATFLHSRLPYILAISHILADRGSSASPKGIIVVVLHVMFGFR